MYVYHFIQVQWEVNGSNLASLKEGRNNTYLYTQLWIIIIHLMMLWLFFKNLA